MACVTFCVTLTLLCLSLPARAGGNYVGCAVGSNCVCHGSDLGCTGTYACVSVNGVDTCVCSANEGCPGDVDCSYSPDLPPPPGSPACYCTQQ